MPPTPNVKPSNPEGTESEPRVSCSHNNIQDNQPDQGDDYDDRLDCAHH